jgi:hypothetical protein
LDDPWSLKKNLPHSLPSRAVVTAVTAMTRVLAASTTPGCAARRAQQAGAMLDLQ